MGVWSYVLWCRPSLTFVKLVSVIDTSSFRQSKAQLTCFLECRSQCAGVAGFHDIGALIGLVTGCRHCSTALAQSIASLHSAPAAGEVVLLLQSGIICRLNKNAGSTVTLATAGNPTHTIHWIILRNLCREVLISTKDVCGAQNAKRE